MLQQNLKTNLGIIKSNIDWHKLIAILVFGLMGGSSGNPCDVDLCLQKPPHAW